jgi:hypothetical protein
MQLLVFSDDEGELIRRYTLAKADLAFVRQHRGDHNRLGIAIQMCSLRFPGRVLAENERPPDRLLNLMATQLGISIGAWNIYAQRDETRREHLLELLRDGPIWDQALPGDFGLAGVNCFADHARHRSCPLFSERSSLRFMRIGSALALLLRKMRSLCRSMQRHERAFFASYSLL